MPPCGDLHLFEPLFLRSLFICVASFSFSSISFFEGGCGFEVYMKKMKFLALGLCLTVAGSVLGAIIGKSAICAGIGAAVGYVAGALIGKYMDKD